MSASGRAVARRRVLLGGLAGALGLALGGGAVWLTTPDQAVGLTSLAGSLEPLRERFNADAGRVRVIALVSPT